MGTLVIRQGDALYLWRSFVWRYTIMSIEKDDVLNMSEGERYIRFCVALQEHQKAGLPFNQNAVDRIASLFNVTPPQLDDDGDSGNVDVRGGSSGVDPDFGSGGWGGRRGL